MNARGLLTVSVLVNDHTSLKRAISDGVGVVPDVHPHTSLLAIWWCSEIGVIVAATVLGMCPDEVIADAALFVVIVLKITRLFVEAEIIQKIMIHVGCIEQLSNRCIGIRLDSS